MNYSYPFSSDWKTEEIVTVVEFFQAIEQAFEGGIKKETLLSKYRAFQSVIPSKAEEKTLFREFEKESGYASFEAVKKLKDAKDGAIIRGGRD
ncbi:UPF0223 family protein [Paenisporosarcina cavernae]|uniref:UPF0223 family protein n=1 Tax=Paenisporosarcina cavernae TaxID=2320858 RepID=A0A385YRJ6_9BACL|nr:UPF0223 family protein [Paenisporosarcina cavernae]AYC29111.1 UPF0223 family protein [Paenisporosarcina cavernae]